MTELNRSRDMKLNKYKIHITTEISQAVILRFTFLEQPSLNESTAVLAWVVIHLLSLRLICISLQGSNIIMYVLSSVLMPSKTKQLICMKPEINRIAAK